MLKQFKYLSRYLSLLIITLGLAACGGGGGTPATTTNPTLSFNAVKTFHFSWADVSGASHYKLMENTDGLPGASWFIQVGDNIPQGTQEVDYVVPLYDRLNAQYVLQTCFGDICNDSEIIEVDDTLVDAIGYFKASNTGENHYFGISVSLSADGSTLAVGSDGESSNSSGINSTPNIDGTADRSGAVYVFTRTDNIWSEQAYIKASNARAYHQFGHAVSMSKDGNTLTVGAHLEGSKTAGINTIPNDDGTADKSGAVYVFSRAGSSWSEQAYIKASNTGANNEFGVALSLSTDGNTMAVGAWNENSVAPRAGAAYIFVRSGTIWEEQVKIQASNTGSNDQFGHALSLSEDGNTLAVGAENEDSDTTGINSIPNNNAYQGGAVYVFSRSGTSWAEQAYIKTSNTDSLYSFGSSVSLSADGSTLAAGAKLKLFLTGTVYIFTRSGENWSEQADIKSRISISDDEFGRSLSLSSNGDTLVIGATGDRSISSGLGTAARLDGTTNTFGAVYVFKRRNMTWRHHTYIKSSNTGLNDRFGGAVSLSADGNTLAVGAINEDSNTTGVGSVPNEDWYGYDSGAVYLY